MAAATDLRKKMTTIDNDIIVRFITDRCTDEELETLRQWMRQSDDNAAEVTRMERVYREAQAHGMPRREVEGALGRLHHRLESIGKSSEGDTRDSGRPSENGVADAFRQEVSSPSPRRISLASWRRVAAAAAVVLVVVGAAFWMLGPFSSRSAEYLVAKATGDVPTELTLADGTRVWLNSGSTLRYPKTFADTLREVEIEGEGYFEVAKNTAKPFVAHGKEMDVRVLGTKFNLSTATGDRAAEVSLIEGKVRVTGADAGGSVVLKPGQKARLAKDGQIAVSSVNTRMDAVWHNGLIPFDGSSIKQIADALQQLYGVQFIIDSGVDLNITYTGEIQWDENLDMVLSRLRNTLPVRFKRHEGKIYIYK